MSKEDGSKGSGTYLSKVSKLVETRDPTEVSIHLKKVAIALLSDGFGEEVNILDPRAEYVRYKSPHYDDALHGMSPQALAFLEPGERMKSVRNNVEGFEKERRRIDLVTSEQEKKLYYLLRSTLSATSLARVMNHGTKRYELAEIRRDTAYLVSAIIITHSSSVTTGLSIIATQQLVMQRVKAYMDCTQGSDTMGQYLEKMNAHIAAISGMDPNVDEDREGGYLGSKDDQVARFLLGTGATVIIHAHMNGTLAEHRIPRSFEEVCTLIANWGGPTRHPGDGKPSTSIMAIQEHECDEHVYGVEERGKPTRKAVTSHTPNKADWIIAKATADKASTLRGVTLPDQSRWTANPSAPATPLRKSKDQTVDRDNKPCWNCFHYHPDPERGNFTSWVTCPDAWAVNCYERHLKWLEKKKRRSARASAPAEQSTAVVVAHAQQQADTRTSAHQYNASEAAIAHAAVMQSRTREAVYAAYPASAGYAGYAPRPRQSDERMRVPWEDYQEEGRFERNYMMTELAAESGVHENTAIAKLAVRRINSLVQIKSVSRVRLGLERWNQVVNTGQSTPVQNFLQELVELVKIMPKTTNAAGRPTWPPTSEQRDALLWKAEQTVLRQNRLEAERCAAEEASDEQCRQRRRYFLEDEWQYGPIQEIQETIHAIASDTESSTSSGVPGVHYEPLPEGSMYSDPQYIWNGTRWLVVWVYDSGAGIMGFKDTYGLEQLHQLEHPVVVGGIVSEKNLRVTTGAILDNVPVLVDDRFCANCLSGSAIVDAGWKIKYHEATDTYQVTTISKKKLTFQRYAMPNGAITKHYLCHPSLPRVKSNVVARQQSSEAVIIASTSVQGNLSMHSVQDAKSAAIAYRFLTKMGGSLAHGIERLPQLRGINITADHVRKAAAIYGPVRSHAQAAATSVQDTAIVTELPSERPKPVPQSLAIDLCCILGVWCVLGVFLPSRYMVVSSVKNHTAPVIFAGVRGMIIAALKRNFDVLQLQADGEKGIHSTLLDDFCAEHKIRVLKVGAGQHEANAERAVRTLKAEVRNIAARIVPRSLPLELLVQLILAATTSINSRLSSALVGSKSPQQIWFGHDHIHAQDLDMAFGDLALANTPNQRNDVAPRADTVMVLYPTFNGLHGYMVYKLGSGSFVVRNYNTLRQIPWTRGDQSAIEKLGDQDAHGVDMPSSEQNMASAPTGVETTMSTIPAGIHGSIEEPIQLPPPRPNELSEATRLGVAEAVPTDQPVNDSTNDSHTIKELEQPVEEREDRQAPEQEQPGPQRRGRRTATSGSSFHNLPAPPGQPRMHTINHMSVRQALRDHPEAAKEAITCELQQMLALKVFKPISMCDMTEGEKTRIIRSSMFLKDKWSPSGEFVKCKARLVAGGDRQDKSLYNNTSSPTASPTSVLIVSGQAAMERRNVATIDIGGAYLNASMPDEDIKVDMVIDAVLTAILINLDPGLTRYVRHNGNLIVRLLKALYGTVQAAKLWNDMIVKILKEDKFTQNPADKCVLNKVSGGGDIVTVVLYVDDLLITCKDQGCILELKAYLETKFPEVTYHSGAVLDYVGMTLDFASQPGAVKVTMKQTVTDILSTSKPAWSESARAPTTPASADLFDVDTNAARLGTDDEAYLRSFVARLLYLAKRVRQDLLTAVAFITTRVNDCTTEDMSKLTRVIEYLRGTADRGIVIDFGADPRVRAFVDASFGVHERDGKSHTGGFIIIGNGGPVYVTSTKQTIVTKSSTEAELVAVSDLASEVISARRFAVGQGLPAHPAVIYQDNNSTMALIDRGGPCSKRSRHIEIRHFWVAEKVASGEIEIVRCPTAVMWANILTKPVQGAQFVLESKGLTNW